MARTTIDQVRNLMDTEAGEDAQFQQVINTASALVTNYLSGSGLPTELMTDIETWLAAHFAACSFLPQVQEEEAEDARVRYISRGGLGLDATRYGQQVKVLDYTGNLAAKMGKQSITFYAVPKLIETPVED